MLDVALEFFDHGGQGEGKDTARTIGLAGDPKKATVGDNVALGQAQSQARSTEGTSRPRVDLKERKLIFHIIEGLVEDASV